ncbi:MAG: hypothetical protein GX895_00500 [Clostridiales bacterium]|uniref:hypothetical protein n=1 Tax=Clostridium sp. N3C TaxID=1776758 RepID=UPI00092E193D|nr:hypothetical protein [Clostridium sp. N3C]NLZ47262.1 hypothetical protein [Clostridiales bacterium]SCN23875.1 hypothetical protein N3C_1540 [Clostridium sp. N3C]
MNINKAIKKQNNSYKRFVLIMGFIFFINPLVLIISGEFNLFFLSYLVIIEVLIIVAVLLKKDANSMSYEYYNGKLKLYQGIFKKKCSIHCEKVVFVHIETKIQDKEDPDIIMLTSSRFRNKKINQVDITFLKKHEYVKKEYEKIKAANPDEEYYYIIVSKGKLIKYKLLMELYKRCVNAKFSEFAIDSIKTWYDN